MSVPSFPVLVCVGWGNELKCVFSTSKTHSESDDCGHEHFRAIIPNNVRVKSTRNISPVHGLQRCALYSTDACAQFLESVPATRVHSIRELVHAIAGLQVRWRSTQHTRAPNTACKRQWIRLPASAPPHPATAHGRQQATIAAKGGLPQPARTAQLPSFFAQKVTMHLLGSSDRTHIHMGESSLS